MLPMLQLLFNHQAWADAVMLDTVAKHNPTFDDEILRKTLHHIAVVQRAFLSLFLERPFDIQKELAVPASGGDFISLSRQTHAEAITFVNGVEEARLSRAIDVPWFPGLRISLGEAMMQVVIHSQSHRGQCALRLRTLGTEPPITDFIVWLKDRPAPQW